jgi:broad specificity phosphatase PhoE
VLKYRTRVDKYQSFFEPLDHGSNTKEEGRWCYLKCDHSRQHFVVHNVKGYLMQKVVNFIMNLRTTQHAFYLSRHGQSEYNNLGRIGGDSGLSEHGVKYAEKLAHFVEEAVTKDANGKETPARLWTSTMRRTKETTQFIKPRKIVVQPDPSDPSQDYEWVQMRPRAWHHLDELFAGSCDGMTYEEIEERFPDEWKLRAADKLAYRYPRGESYLDVIARLEPIIIEMERHQEPLLIVAHQGILRIIYAFYMGLSRSEAPYVTIKLNCVTELTPMVYGCTEKVRFCSPVMVLAVSGGGCYCAMSRQVVLIVEVYHSEPCV